MQKPILLWFLVILAGFPLQASTQSNPQITSPELSIQNKQLVISYGIENSSAKEIYKVWIEIRDDHDHKINALSLSGDIGDAICGGLSKQIIWDYSRDLPDANKKVFLEVCAEVIPPVIEEELPVEVPIRNNETAEEMLAGTPTSGELTGSGMRYTKGKALYRSALYPGLGFTGMDKSKLHLLKGFTSYGCLVSSLILNRTAINSYESYKVTSTIEERAQLLASAKRQDNISEILAWSAAGIWAIELAWIFLKPLKGTGKVSAMHVAPGVDPISMLPVFSLAVRF